MTIQPNILLEAVLYELEDQDLIPFDLLETNLEALNNL